MTKKKLIAYYGVIQNLVGTPPKKHWECSPQEKGTLYIIWGIFQPMVIWWCCPTFLWWPHFFVQIFFWKTYMTPRCITEMCGSDNAQIEGCGWLPFRVSPGVNGAQCIWCQKKDVIWKRKWQRWAEERDLWHYFAALKIHGTLQSSQFWGPLILRKLPPSKTLCEKSLWTSLLKWDHKVFDFCDYPIILHLFLDAIFVSYSQRWRELFTL